MRPLRLLPSPLRHSPPGRGLGCLALVLVLGCAASPPASSVPLAAPAPAAGNHGEHEHGLGFQWFSGSVEQALAAARAQGRPVFLYWGAVWCPPCLQLKAEVFPQPRFAARMRSFIPVYLDGDAAEAQSWGERLRISSYPAMLVLAPEGGERMRILGAIELEELDAALAGALDAGGGAQGAELAVRVARALAGRGSTEDWTLLSLQTWYDSALAPEGGWAARIDTLRGLAERVPPGLVEASARLAGSLLQAAAAAPPGEPGVARAQAAVRAGCPGHLEALLGEPARIVAARTAVLESAAPLRALCAPEAGSPAAVALGERLSRAAALLAARAELPLEVHLSALGPDVALWKQGHPGQPVPAELRRRNSARVAELLAAPIAAGMRHTLITGAAELLADSGDDEGARRLLLAELPQSKVPWYLADDLAQIAAGRGEVDEALRWSAEAVRLAQGGATQVQWRVQELKLLLRLRPPLAEAGSAPTPELAQLVDRLRGFYQLVLSLPDGFAGRNKRRLGMVAQLLAPLARRPPVAALIDEQAARCPALEPPARSACQAHFASLRPPLAAAPPRGG